VTGLWWLLTAAATVVPPDTSFVTAPVPPEQPATGPRIQAVFPTYDPGFGAALPDTQPRRPRAVEHSDFYYTRLSVHRAASYAIVPLFVTEFALGQSLYTNPPGSSTTRTAHSVVAYGVIGLFGLNTITGAWNLWDSRHDPTGGARRYIHAALMLAADIGFAATAAVAPGGRRAVRDPSSKTQHRDVALVSMGVALTGYGMMLVWK
jgi:hypothetical protein